MYTLRSLLLFMPSYGSVFATSSVYQGSAMIVVIVSYPPRLCITIFLHIVDLHFDESKHSNNTKVQ